VCWPGDPVRLQPGMETRVAVKLGVAAECAEFFGLLDQHGGRVERVRGVAAKCAGPATQCGSSPEWKLELR